jgi:predicted transposase YbfD/YdcC
MSHCCWHGGDVERLFNDPPDGMAFETHEAVELTGGRIETRRHTICHNSTDIGPALSKRTRVPGTGHDRTDRDRALAQLKGRIRIRYYLCSLGLNALNFARAVRAHWGVEDRPHWVLDVTFHEDLARFMTGDGPQNMAIIRNTAPNLLARAKPTSA